MNKRMSGIIGVDKIYCINLDSRPDRWERMQKRFVKYNLDVHRISAIQAGGDIVGPAEACSFSHLLALRDGKLHNYNRIIILEDDVRLLNNFVDEIVKTIENLKNDFDILMLDGCSLDFKLDRGIHKSIGDYLASGYCVNSTCIDKLVNIMDNQTPNYHIENALVTIQREGENSYIPTPRLCIQEMLCSNIKSQDGVDDMKGWYDRCYFPLYNDYE
jgi:glycosyl transferase family 25